MGYIALMYYYRQVRRASGAIMNTYVCVCVCMCVGHGMMENIYYSSVSSCFLFSMPGSYGTIKRKLALAWPVESKPSWTDASLNGDYCISV